MSTYQSLLLGIRSSGDYFISTFMFGVMFGIAASAAGLSQWQALLCSYLSYICSLFHYSSQLNFHPRRRSSCRVEPGTVENHDCYFYDPPA